jgi:protein phosphatase
MQVSTYSNKSIKHSQVSKSPAPARKSNITFMPAVFGKKEEERRPSYEQRRVKDSSIAAMFLNNLMQPKLYINNPEGIKFMFKPEHIHTLCEQVEAVIREQPLVLRVKAPVKVFGDIHGQYSDLMSFFLLYGSPFENGKDKDIESFDYIFLGDFVDRGINSLETICLLFALKVRYPGQVHLIRGNHEDKWINCSFGFSEECAMKLNEDPNHPDSVFARVNQVFEWLPLAAVIEEKILCLHGGIGSTVNSVSDIEGLPRPLEVIHEVTNAEEQLVVDILWSDPTDSDAETGIIQNVMRDPQGTGNIVKFGPDRVHKFLKANDLEMIIRAHECVMDGFERFAGGALMTVFSATDYCGRHKNAGAILIIGKDLEIKPKNIYSESMRGNTWIEDEEQLRKRPPTPPRWRSNGSRKSGV